LFQPVWIIAPSWVSTAVGVVDLARAVGDQRSDRGGHRDPVSYPGEADRPGARDNFPGPLVVSLNSQ